jgi:predicted transcriptional regulator
MQSEKRARPYADERPAVFRFEKWLQTHAGKHPAAFYGLYRLARKDQGRVVTPETQLVIEGFPRSANSFARVAFNRAQKGTVRIATGLHVPAQVVRAARWRIPTLVLIRRPKDAVLSFAIRDPISVEQALKYYLSFYETVEGYSDAYVLGTFEEVTGDFGPVIQRLNERFGTSFSPFRHNERNVEVVLARVERNSKRKFGEAHWENKASRPVAAREETKRELERGLNDSEAGHLLSRAEAVYERLTAAE